MESREINGLKQAAVLLERYTALGTLEEIRTQRRRLLELTAERDALRADCEKLSQQVERQKKILRELNIKLDKLEGRL